MAFYQGSFFNLDADVDAAAVAIVDATGTQLSGFDSSRPTTATTVSISATVSSGVILASNPARRQFVIFNNSGKNLFITYGATTTLTLYSIKIASNGSYESVLNGYTGVISGLWSGTGGAALVTEVAS